MQSSRDRTARLGPRSEGPDEARHPIVETGVDEGRRARQLALLQEWRGALGDAGYVTLVSVFPPMGLLVRAPNIDHRWIEISTNGLVIVFAKDELGEVHSEYHLLYSGEGNRVGPSARVALQAASDYLFVE